MICAENKMSLRRKYMLNRKKHMLRKIIFRGKSLCSFNGEENMFESIFGVKKILVETKMREIIIQREM